MTKTLLLSLVLFSNSLLAQDKGVNITMPEIQLLYVGFDNLIEISFDKKSKKGVSLECVGCSRIERIDKAQNQWVIRTDSVGPVTLIAKSKKGDTLSELKLKSFEFPQPNVFIDGIGCQNAITHLPESIALKLHESIPLNIRFLIKNWEATIDNKVYKVSGSKISTEVQEVILQKKQGTALLLINYMDSSGNKSIREIIEFDIK